MGEYYLIHGQLYSEDELYHHGVKGQKWGVRRYQNKDGSLTDAGKKRLVKDITSRKANLFDAQKMAKDVILNDTDLAKWRTSQAYKNAANAKLEYEDAKRKYYDKQEPVWRKVVSDTAKKHGQYEDLIRAGDKKKIAEFDKDYDALLDKRFKQHGIYDLERDKDRKYDSFLDAHETFKKETRSFVENYLGKYGDVSLKGFGSAVYKGRDIVDRVKVADVFVEAYADIDHVSRRIYYSHRD